MIRPRRRSPAAALLLIAALAPACTHAPGESSWEESSYHVQRRPGDDAFSRSHYPSVERRPGSYAISVGLPAEGAHRIEEIRVLAGDETLARLVPVTVHGQSFALWEPGAPVAGPLRFVARCNQHLLFETRVEAPALAAGGHR